MATIRQTLRCKVCGTLMLTRTQVGWLDEHPVRLHCGQCNILFSGTARFSSSPPRAEITFDNAEDVKEATPAYYAEVSGELLTLKVSPYDGNPYPLASFFHAAVQPMGHEGYDDFKRRTLTFLSHLRDQWPLVRRVNELWRDGNHEFLPKQCHQVLPRRQFPMNSTLELLRGVHTLNVFFLMPLLDGDRFGKTTKFLFDTVTKLPARPFAAMASVFEENGLLVRYETKLFERLEAFCSIFRYLIPIFGTHFYQPDQRSHSGKGVTTASFEDLKQFYLDTYEVITEVARLVAAYNNLQHRGDHMVMTPLRKDVVSLDDFGVRTKANRLEFFTRGESFDQFIFPIPDNKLRNTIGHNAYRFDGARQLLIYSVESKRPAHETREKELVEFLQDCWDLFSIVVNLGEMVYQTRKVYRLMQHDFFVGAEVFKRPRVGPRPARKKSKKRKY